MANKLRGIVLVFAIFAQTAGAQTAMLSGGVNDTPDENVNATAKAEKRSGSLKILAVLTLTTLGIYYIPQEVIYFRTDDTVDTVTEGSWAVFALGVISGTYLEYKGYRQWRAGRTE